jgi:nucleotide-binding universal stress UspA family protein
MLSRLIVGYDASAEAQDALELGKSLAALADAELILAAVLPLKDEAIGVEARGDPDRLFEAVLPRLTGLNVKTRAVSGKPAADALRELAEHEGANAIMLGSTHRGPVGRIYPGSVAERLLHGAPCAVAVAPRGFAARAGGEPRVLAVGFDASPESQAALELAGELAAAAEATLRVVAVHEPFTATSAGIAPMGTYDVGAVTQREAMQERLDEALAGLPAELRAKGLLLKGGAAEELLKETELGVDLLVMGSRGHGPLGRVLLGAVSAKVVRSASCPVLVMPRSASHEPGRATAGSAALGPPDGSE